MMDIKDMPAGPEIDDLVCRIMEEKPVNIKTFAQLEQEDGGNYGCWSITSPSGWWKINIDWGDIRKEGRQYEIPDWKSAYEFSDDIAAAWEVVEQMKNKELYMRLFQDGSYGCFFTEPPQVTVWAETAPLAICRAALMAINKQKAMENFVGCLPAGGLARKQLPHPI
ncbi:MAG: hypothetical protein HPY66_1691 [Firmicutes bacterium]|nr:hypothetical protein [Bacillota bacterium]